MNHKKLPFVLYGGDYNPDQWDEATLERDIEYFKTAGINLVTLPVFSWAKLEPEEGVYQFEWLDRIVNRLWENKIYICMATPTTAQPAWLSKRYPEVLPADIAGRKRTHGMRVFFCYNSEKYRERAAAIAEEMAKRYGDFPGVAAWHVSNEYGTYCYCENCQKKFRAWLKERYHNIETLNEKWNSSFWGRTVYDFDEVMLPTELNDDYRFNPSIQLDYMRFVTDSTIECYENEAKILKSYSPNIPVFTNISGMIKKLDQFKMVSHMDCAGWDNYPGPMDDRSLPAMKHDIMRALKDGAPFFITEQSPNQQNWQPYNKLKKPGELRTIAYQGLAHGGDTCLYFQMRQSVGGQEKFHGAFISHADTKDTRIFSEAVSLGAELKKLRDTFIQGRTKAKVGILFDWDNWWALELTSGPTKDMDYLMQVNKYYKAFYDKNIPVDMLKVTSDLSRYKIIVAPLLYMEKEGIAKKIEEFVKQGGTFIATYMTGLADENDRCIFGAYPGKYRKTLGLWVEETQALYPEEHNTLIIKNPLFAGKYTYECSFLCDVIHLEGAETIAVYGEDFFEGKPAVTVNQFGKGKAYYLATEPEEDFLDGFIEKICDDLKIHSLFETEGMVEVAVRENPKGKSIFVINHSDGTGTVNFGGNTYFDCLQEKEVDGKYLLKAREVLILKG